MSECRCLAARSRGKHDSLLAQDVYVEIPGERGEITLTGGRSPYLPLLRYRTSDLPDRRDARPDASIKSTEVGSTTST